MIIKNIGTKIVNIGSIVLMPGDETNIAEAVANVPSVQALCKMGFLSVDEEKKAEEVKKPAEVKQETEEASEEAAEEPVEEVKKTSTRGRKTTKKATE